MPALLQRAQLIRLLELLDQLPQDYRNLPIHVRNGIQEVLDSLSDAALDERQFIPPRIPSPYGSAVDATGYKAYLEALNPKILLYSTLVKEGFEPAAAEDNGHLSGEQVSAVKNTLGNIDSLATDVPLPTSDQARQTIQNMLTLLHNTLYPPPPAFAAAFAVAQVPVMDRRGELDSVQIQLQSIGKGIWMIYAILTAATGAGFLILNNPGFGIPLDLLFALFWGFEIGAVRPIF
jgi:hypothetical protein